MNSDHGVWVLPAVSFCLFVGVLVVIFINAYEKISFSNHIANSQNNQSVMSMQDFQKAMNSLK